MALTDEQMKAIFAKFMSDMSSQWRVMPYSKTELLAVISEMDNAIEAVFVNDTFVSVNGIVETNMPKLVKEKDGESKDITFKQGEGGNVGITVLQVKENLKKDLLGRIVIARAGVK